MAWRFQPSKFKNTTPKVPKKEETIFDLPIGTLSCTNNGIQSNQGFLAFCIEGEGGKLGVLPSDARGRRVRTEIDVVCAHGDQLDDFAFLPFEENKLVTCSRDDKVKVWTLCASSPAVLSAEVDIGSGRLLSALAPHSTASDIVAVASTSSVFVVDVARGEAVGECSGVREKALSVSWSDDGKMMAASADKGRQGLFWDVRASSTPVHEMELHSGMGREARCIHAGDNFVSTAFTNKRVQEVRVWDARKWATPLMVKEYTATTGVLIPQFDPDTKLLFLAGKGTNKIFLQELQQKQPVISDVYELNVPDQVLGFSLAPKRTVKPMDGEVARMYQLTKNSIVPIPCIVPRRSYRELHVDLFPDTRGPIAGCSGKAWLEGSDEMPERVSMTAGHRGPECPPPEPTPPPALRIAAVPKLAPTMAKPAPPPSAAAAAPVAAPRASVETEEPKELAYEGGEKTAASSTATTISAVEPEQVAPKLRLSKQLSDEKADATSLKENVPASSSSSSAVPSSTAASAAAAAPPSARPSLARAPSMPASAVPEVKLRVLARSDNDATPRLNQRIRPKSCVVGQVQSKYRHVETLAGVKAGAVFSNLRNVNTRLPTECNGAVASSKYVAVPLAGPAGVIMVLDVDSPQKIPDGVVDGIYNKAGVTDLAWSPFDSSLLVVGTDQGLVNIWRIPEKKEGEEETPRRTELEPEQQLRLGGEKIVNVRWHPLAEGLLAIGLSDGAVELWTISSSGSSRRARLHSHSSPILSLAWSIDGSRLATVAKDLELHVWSPQTSTEALEHRLEGAIESARGARVVFACDDSMIIVAGFTKSSGRQLLLYCTASSSLLYRHQLDNAVQPLVPYYDFDSSVLFLTGKGDQSIQMFEVCREAPFLLELSRFQGQPGHQSIAYHNKSVCKVMEVEFVRAWRLTEKTLEMLRFRVPRVKKDVFQSDLFPDALVTWEPRMTADEWLAGAKTAPLFRSLRPEGVAALAVVAPTPAATPARSTARTAASETSATTVSMKEEPAAPAPILIPAATPKEKEVMAAWSTKIELGDGQLEQDRMEGVPEEDWKE
ncbi:pod-1 [Pristionchus pacificus]|uniref:Coronin n=1 Tax=Pristionchus pacificus TaxID=54126 RepID=A0A2A6BPA3_PRIPA|nr:pod-1 [Pristionchus pacificus]|eukprot:PDM67734.1 pod-1 [Pristionchus pacificus]